MCNETLLQRIISSIRESINQYAVNKMTRRYDFDPARVNYEMKHYRYKTFGDYARSNLFKTLFTKDI